MITSSWDGTIKYWDLFGGMIEKKHTYHKGAINAVDYNKKGNYMASGGVDRSIILWNPEKGQILSRLEGHTYPITSLEFTNDGEKLVSCSSEGMIKVWDLKTFEELYSYMQIDSENWLVTNPHGYFDGSKDALKLVNYVNGLEVVPITSLFDKYYTPNLSKRIMNGEKFVFNDSDINETLKSAPKVKISLASVSKRKQLIEVVEDSTYEWKSQMFLLKANVEANKGLSLIHI